MQLKTFLTENYSILIDVIILTLCVHTSNNYVDIHSDCHGKTCYCSHSQALQNGELWVKPSCNAHLWITELCGHIGILQAHPQHVDRTHQSSVRPGKETADHDSCADGVFAYASEVLTLSLLYAEFEDAIKEGDGERVVHCRRFFLLIFKPSNRMKYSLEAVKLLVNICVLPPRLREQLICSRFVNTKGKAGEDKPCDQHMEHLNRTVKSVLGHQGSNLTQRAILRIGKCVGPLLKGALKWK